MLDICGNVIWRYFGFCEFIYDRKRGDCSYYDLESLV